MKSLLALISAISICATASAAASDMKVLPTETALVGPEATQRLIIESLADGKFVGDVTDAAKIESCDPSVVTVDALGVLRPAGDGEATITATIGDRQATARVTVTKFNEEFTWSFNNHVIPAMTKLGCNSGACHGALAGKGGLKLSLRGYDPLTDHFVLTRQAGGRRVDLAEPERSLFLEKPTATIRHGGGKRIDVPSPAFQILSQWVAAGAPKPDETAPKVVGLEVFPDAVTAKPGDNQQVIVRALYSDGHAEDVTRWSKFSSSQDLVASADETGRVTVAGHGEASINVSYANLVAFARITSPMPNEILPKVFAEAARNNFIDELNIKKLETLRLPPSPLCSDNEFIRRAYLDAAGILPTPEEVERFVADSAPDKRAKLIDNILERPEFIDYWTYKWSDLLLVSSRELPQSAMWAFFQWVRKSVAENKPWDEFAREILTATGSTLANGAGNYFVLHKDVTELTETTSVTFLGMSITCARCHNHPLEKWTQDQYYGMANLFSRVTLKNGERGGDLVVFASTTGDIAHPRLGVPMLPRPLDDTNPAAPTLESTADRRAYFVDWLTRPDNAFFARAIVNRVWTNFLGRGLVDPEDDLRLTNPSSNEELFAALAKDFVTPGASGRAYDVKHLIRTIMNSATYQRSSVPLPENIADDRYYSHYLIRRLTAEVALDAYSQVTGVPTPFTQLRSAAGDALENSLSYPLGTRALQLPDSLVASQFLLAFGRPDRVQTCSCERQQDSSVTQALHLNNGETLNNKLRDSKCRVEKWLEEKVSDSAAIDGVFLLALARRPTDAERQKLAAVFAESATEAATDEKVATEQRRQMLQDLFWAVLTDREFLFNH
jgi:hypothetical protein